MNIWRHDFLTNGCLAIFSFYSIATIGCQPASTDSTAPMHSANKNGTADEIHVASTPSDDTEAITKLTEAGFNLTKNKEGVVTECSVGRDDDFVQWLPFVAKLSHLQTVTFSGPGIKDQGMEALEELTKLKQLNLTGSAITDETMHTLGKLSSLQVLKLRRTGVTDEGLQQISGLNQLRAIDLRNTNITDTGLTHLAFLQSLVDIQVERSGVTDAAQIDQSE